MITWSAGCRAQIGSALAFCPELAEVAGNRWRVGLAGAPPLSMHALWEDEWLRFDCRVADGRRDSLWDLLCLQSALPSAVKLTVRADAALHLVADIDLVAAADLAAEVRQCCAAIRQAAEVLRGRGVPVKQPADDEAPLSESLREACAASRWKVSARGVNRLAVDLEVEGDFAQAIVEQRQETTVIWAALADDDEISNQTCREALALMLLRLNGAIRSVRAVGGPTERAPRLEVSVSTPGSTALERIFSALSVGWLMVGREARLLREDDAIARLFLQSRHLGTQGEKGVHAEV